MTAVEPLVTSFAIGLVAVPAVRRIAIRRGFVANPRADRWHHRPTALFGGVGIWLAVVAGLARPSATGDVSFGDPVWGIALGATILWALGVVDDRLDVKPATKIVAQLVATSIVVFFGYRLTFFSIEVINLALTFLWMVAITNAVNLLDNMDGLAAGVMMIAAVYLGVSHSGSGGIGAETMAFCLAGALAAFLFFNFNPASIFMGDSGSMFIGFTVAALSLAESRASSLLTFVAVPVATLLVPILDTTLVTATRAIRGRSISIGGRDHASHRLVMLGLSEREAVTLLWVLAAVAGAAAIFTERYSYPLGLAILPLLIVGFGLLGIYLSRLSFADATTATEGYVRLAIDFSYKRRVLEVLLDMVLIVLAYYTAFALRLEFDFDDPLWGAFYRSLPFAVGCTMVAFFVAGVYRGVWTYVSTPDVSKYASGCAAAVASTVAVVWVAQGFDGYPRSALAIFGLLLFLFIGATRVSFRLMDEALGRHRGGLRVLLVGAGSAGEIAARELLRNGELGRKALGFLDDDATKHGRWVHGLPVLGGIGELDRVFAEKPFDEIVVATEKMSPQSLERVRGFVEAHALGLRYFHVGLHEKPLRAERSVARAPIEPLATVADVAAAATGRGEVPS